MSDFKLDFSGIGVAKSGTTWIALCLAEHPRICMATGKETNFFLRTHIASSAPVRGGVTVPVHNWYYGTAHYDEGIEWYERKFTHHRPGQIYGEFSNTYLSDSESAGLLHAHNPDLKLLCCFRNPVDVAYAGYFQLSRVKPLPGTFEQFLAEYPQLLEYGRYHHNLQSFLRLFPRERFHLMLYDDIKPDPAGFYRQICEFLEIDPAFVPDSLSRRVNPRTVLRSRALRNLRCAIGDFMAATAATRKLRAGLLRLGALRIAMRLFSLNEKPGTVPPMASQTRQRLVEMFRTDNDALAELLHRDLSQWNA